MIRHPTLLALAVVALAACAPAVELRAPCNSDVDCPEGMSCKVGLCEAGGMGPGPVVVDGGARDADSTEGGSDDAGDVDPGDVDAGVIDAGDVDAGGVDAGVIDAGGVDAGVIDEDAGTLPDGGVDAGPLLPADWWRPGWGARRLLRFQNAFQDEDLEGFPVLVEVDADMIDLSRVAEGGRDLRFVDADAVTVLPHEIERWNPSGRSQVWVRVPRIDRRSTTDHIWLYYDNPAAPAAEDPSALWADYHTVLHMAPDPAVTTGEGLLDATENAHAGATNTTARAGGIAGDAVSLSGTGESIEVPSLSGASFPQQSGSVMLWVKGDLGAQAESDNFFDSWSSARDHLFLRAHGGGDVQMAAQLSGDVYDASTVRYGWSSAGSWHLVGASFDVSAQRVQLFIDDDEHGPYPFTTWTPAGQDVAFGRGWEGLVDEARVAGRWRSQRWMRAEYLVGRRRFVIVGEPALPPPAPARTSARVAGALALYDFDEGAGTTAADSSGVGAPLDLTLLGAEQTEWLPGGLRLRGPALLTSGGPASKISDACVLSGAITVEAWVMPDNALLDGPARIAGISANPSVRNFTLGQDRDRYIFRVRTSVTGSNGTSNSTTGTYVPETPSGSVDVSAPAHVVFTRLADGHTHGYVNGALVTEIEWPGDVAGWDPALPLLLGNELDDNGTTAAPSRPWMGTLYLVAVYDRALSDAEVLQNYAAGP